MPKVILITKDLFFIAKIREVASASGLEMTVARNPDSVAKAISEAAGEPIFLVDLEKSGFELPELAKIIVPHVSTGAPCVSFYSHVNGEVCSQAESLGLGTIMPRSEFVKVLPDLLRS